MTSEKLVSFQLSPEAAELTEFLTPILPLAHKAGSETSARKQMR